MMGPAKRRESKLFYTGVNLEERVPEDHVLRRIASAVSFGGVRSVVADRYGRRGHKSLDPVLVVKLMLLLFLENVPSERALMRQLPLRLDWLWFLEMDLDEAAPHHSVLSKARRLWGLEVFEALFTEVLNQCQEAGLVGGEASHADSTVISASASVDSRVARRLWERLESGVDNGEDGPAGRDPQDPDATDGPDDGQGRRTPPPAQDTQASRLPAPPRGRFNAMIVSTTDPDAATTKRRGRGVTLGYRDHCLVDDRCGIITATIATAADYDDGMMLETLLDEHRSQLGDDPRRVTGDSAYGTRHNIQRLRDRGILPYVKPRANGGGRGGWLDRMPPECPRGAARRWLGRRLAVAEGRFAHAKTRHGHGRCRWRRRWRVQIQCYLVATTQNILKLTRYRTRPKPPNHAAAAPLAAPTATATARFIIQHPPALAAFIRRAACRVISYHAHYNPLHIHTQSTN